MGGSRIVCILGWATAVLIVGALLGQVTHRGPVHYVLCANEYRHGETFEPPPPEVVTIGDLDNYIRDQTHNCGHVEIYGNPLSFDTPIDREQFSTRFAMESDRTVYIWNLDPTDTTLGETAPP